MNSPTIDPNTTVVIAIDTCRSAGSVGARWFADDRSRSPSLSMSPSIPPSMPASISIRPVAPPAAVHLAAELQRLRQQIGLASWTDLKSAATNPEPPRGVIAVANGPGSFTGLRVGVTTAKTMAHAIGCPVVAVDALSAVARQHAIDNDPTPLLVVAKAYRKQSYVASFGPDPIDRCPTQMLGNDEVDQMITEHLDRGIMVLTDRSDLPGARPMPATTAAGVLSLATDAIATADWSDPLPLQPNYFRPSAAEEQFSGKA